MCVLVLKKSLQFPWQFVIKEGPGGEIDAQSHLELARHFERKNDFRSAFQEIQKAAAKGLTEANFHLGQLYHAGPKSSFKLNKNVKRALHYYEIAAAKHRGEAMCAIGMMYQNGDGVERNHATAAEWHRRCADPGQVRYDKALNRQRSPSHWALTSMFNLGLIYHEGKWSVPQDDAEAVKWWIKGKEHDFPAAIYNLGIMYFYGFGVDKDEREADVLFKRASRLNPSIKAPTVEPTDPPQAAGGLQRRTPLAGGSLTSPEGKKPAGEHRLLCPAGGRSPCASWPPLDYPFACCVLRCLRRARRAQETHPRRTAQLQEMTRQSLLAPKGTTSKRS